MSIEDLYKLDNKKEEVVYIDSSKKYSKIPEPEEIFDNLKLYQNIEPETKRPLDFSKIKSIRKVAKPLQRYIENIDTNSNPNDDIIVGGSGAAWTQLKKSRLPNDPDLEVSPEYIERTRRDIIKIIKNKYKNVTIQQLTIGNENTKVIQILINGHPAVDIKAHKQIGTRLNVHFEDLYHEILTRPPIRIGKIYYTHLSELYFRKGRSVIEKYHQNKKDGKEIPERVEKDFSDFMNMTKSFRGNKQNLPKKSKKEHKKKEFIGINDKEYWMI